MKSAPPWSSLVYQVVDQARKEPESRRVLFSLPSTLSHGASALEIARATGSKPDKIEILLRSLSSYRVLEAQPSGASVPYAGTLYFLGPDASEFFHQVEVLLSSSNAPGSSGL